MAMEKIRRPHLQEMRNISKEVILNCLIEAFCDSTPAELSESQKSTDRTIKSAFQLVSTAY
jgi:hypothetical protein